MGITMEEFRLAMETYGAKKVDFMEATKCAIPCFNVCGVDFVHSGSFYIVQQGYVCPTEIFNQSMAELGEKSPGERNHFWYREIHSIRGLLTLSAMLDGKYSKELVNRLTSETYKKLFNSSTLKVTPEFPFDDRQSPKMKKLYAVLQEYNNMVNPFNNSELDFKEPIEYLDKVNFSMACNSINHSVDFIMHSGPVKTNFTYNSSGWCYDSKIYLQRNRKNAFLHMGHYYHSQKTRFPVAEIVRLKYSPNYNNGFFLDTLDLRINLQTGLAWKPYDEKNALLATEEEIDTMIAFLKVSIKKIKHKLIHNMVHTP